MFSLKDSIRKVISITIASALATTVFVGCAKQDTSSTSLETPVVTTTTAIAQNVPGIEEGSEVASNTLFHWVEEPAGASLAVSAADFLENAEQDTGETDNDYGLSVYVKDTEKYLHSGNLILPLTEDGDFANAQDEMLVRYVHEPNTSSGAKIYIYHDTAKGNVSQMSLTEGNDLINSTDKFWQVLKNQVSTNHEEYVIANALAENTVDIPSNALVWYNGIATDIRANGQMIPLRVLTDDFMNILSFTKQNNGYTFTLYTGIGEVVITASVADDGRWTFAYTLPKDCLITHEDVKLDADSITEIDGMVYVSSDVLTKVFNYFVFTFNSVDMGDGSTDDIAVIVTDNQDILKSDKAARDEANRIAAERDAMPATEETNPYREEGQAMTKTAEQLADEYDKNGGIPDDAPRTTAGGLVEPAKLLPGMADPSEGKDKTFTGDAATALRTELPEGCYWSPSRTAPNAFTDPAGNRWYNQKSSIASGNRGEGYITPDYDYYASQAEIDRYNELMAEAQERYANGPSNFKDAQISEEDANELADLFGF